MKLAFERNKYGVSARATLVADYVEACAWKYARYQFDNMESILRPLGRVRVGEAHVTGSTASEEDEETAGFDEEVDPTSASGVMDEPSDDAQRNVITVLHERQKELGELYPFSVDDVSIAWKRTPVGAYDSLLALTLSHAFGIIPNLSTKTIEVLFEHVTARCLGGAHWIVHDVGGSGRTAGSFDRALEDISKKIGWKLHSAASSKAVDAQEEGCDTLIMLPWKDSRPGRLFLIGQATVAKSEQWKKKIKEPSPTAWGPRLQRPQYPAPIPFLAVPHHIERGTFIMLQEHGSGFVVDRLRLATGAHANDLSADEHATIDLVRSADIEV